MVTTGYLERDATVAGLKLHYQEWGNPSSPTILMLHGFGVSGHMFDEFAERMQDRFHLIALDQRGHGDSDWSESGDYSRDAFVADVEGFRQALGLERFVLVGHSMGGMNAVTYTARYSPRVRALVLVDVGPEAAKEGVENITRFTRGPDELEFDEFVEMAHRFNPRRTIENIRDRMRHRLRQMENGKWTWKFDRRFRQQDNGLRIGSQLSNDEMWALFRSITVPTLLVRGGESDVLTQEVADRAAREMTRTRLVVVPGAGHSVPGDNPDGFTAAVSEFLGDIEAGTFETARPAEPPALEEMVARQKARRRPPVGLLVLAGAGAAIALSGLLMAARHERQKKRQQRTVKARAARAASELTHGELLRHADLERAQRRAAELSHELAEASRRGLAHARAAVQEVELKRAREAALDVLHALGESAHDAEHAVQQAATRIDTKKLKKGATKRAKKGRSAGGLALHLAFLAATRALATRSGAKKKRGRLAWPR